MEALVAVVLIESFLINTLTVYEKKKRVKLLTKWVTGNITLEEIRFLKRQPWFQKNFKEVTVSTEKKND